MEMKRKKEMTRKTKRGRKRVNKEDEKREREGRLSYTES